ncbi:hypothetical protein G7046_g7238 [Stylonectria norvegica]|nr:hypothetical protein G7046_g7238 [Stylonectria norvegica]
MFQCTGCWASISASLSGRLPAPSAVSQRVVRGSGSFPSSPRAICRAPSFSCPTDPISHLPSAVSSFPTSTPHFSLPLHHILHFTFYILTTDARSLLVVRPTTDNRPSNSLEISLAFLLGPRHYHLLLLSTESPVDPLFVPRPSSLGAQSSPAQSSVCLAFVRTVSTPVGTTHDTYAPAPSRSLSRLPLSRINALVGVWRLASRVSDQQAPAR